jgi:hypothetical protein
MLDRLRNYLLDLRDRQRIGIALSRGAAMMRARNIDPASPGTWEFSGFSQNGEDGILDVLRRHLRSANRYFVEIGVADGIENNTAWLAVAEKYSGIMVEGNALSASRAQRTIASHNVSVECRHLFVTRESAVRLASLVLHPDPDVFSLDIDGNDYYVAQSLLDCGIRPKILAVEYNSVFGPGRSATIEYREDFDLARAHPSQLYYGVSISGWRTFLGNRGYRFVTVDRNGVNAFFVDPMHFDTGFVDGIKGLPFSENRYQLMKFREPSERQFMRISDAKFVSI